MKQEIRTVSTEGGGKSNFPVDLPETLAEFQERYGFGEADVCIFAGREVVRRMQNVGRKALTNEKDPKEAVASVKLTIGPSAAPSTANQIKKAVSDLSPEMQEKILARIEKEAEKELAANSR